jgi:hypothetical protein
MLLLLPPPRALQSMMQQRLLAVVRTIGEVDTRQEQPEHAAWFPPRPRSQAGERC